MKHVGKMKNNGAKIVIVYRTLPGDALSALVVGTQGLTDTYHDGLMQLLESPAGQEANELADVLAVRRFADGSNMLYYLHANGHLKKVPTESVLVTPDTKSTIPLDELNVLISQQKGIKLEDLAIKDGVNPVVQPVSTNNTEQTTKHEVTTPVLNNEQKIARAKALQEEAERLLREVKESKEEFSKTTSADV